MTAPILSFLLLLHLFLFFFLHLLPCWNGDGFQEKGRRVSAAGDNSHLFFFLIPFSNERRRSKRGKRFLLLLHLLLQQSRRQPQTSNVRETARFKPPPPPPPLVHLFSLLFSRSLARSRPALSSYALLSMSNVRRGAAIF